MYDSETKSTKEIMTNAEFPDSAMAFYKSPSREAEPETSSTFSWHLSRFVSETT